MTVWYAGAYAPAYQTVIYTEQITNLTFNFSCVFISILRMFRAAMCPSPGELLYQCDTWFMSHCVDDRLVCRSLCSCIPGFKVNLFEQESIRTLYRIRLKALNKRDDDDKILLLYKFYILRSVDTLAVAVIIFARPP